MTAAYTELERRFRRLSLLGEAAGILQWDMAAVMPDGGAGIRGEQLAELKVVGHEAIVDPRIADLLDKAERDESAALDPWRRANLHEMRRAWRHASALPGDLVAALSRTVSECEMRWRGARAANDYKGLQPLMQRVLDLTIEAARIKGQRFNVDPYDALIDEYEPGADAARIAAIFDDLAAFLPGFIERVLVRQAAAGPIAPLGGPFPAARQRALAETLMRAIGFDFDHGRLDTSHHPFCGGVPEDVRITTRWDEKDFTRGLMGVLHETGHAMYERGLPADWRLQPVGAARGMALHESQSLLVEMQACRSREFVSYLAPLAAQAFGGTGAAWGVDNLHRHYTRVARGLIRVDADETTYPCHIILRFRLERALIGGDMTLDDLPAAWNAGMKELVGIVPPDDKDGCLQDIHWPGGAWGYFPTYTLGALAAAQLFEAAVRAVPGIPAGLARGDFAPLMAWLRPNVHAKASSGTTDEILAAATGKPLGTDSFKRHLERRYLA
ncbi:MAG: carboxypeptidase M32 [Alphaproteobacteria bacterium]|nr:carboxypeptidase M32 [Alphaproteobacteria bacterium]